MKRFKKVFYSYNLKLTKKDLDEHHEVHPSSEAYFKNASTSFDCRETKTVEQAKELIIKGYEYITEMDGVKLFRKPDST